MSIFTESPIQCKVVVENINSRTQREIMFEALSLDVALVTAKAILWDKGISSRTNGITLYVNTEKGWKETVLHGEYHNPDPRLYEALTTVPEV